MREIRRLHEQLGGDEPDDLDQEVENLLADWRRVRADGADYGLTCPDCDRMTSDGEYCGECISERASYYHPDPDEEGQG
jgi:hypothetical protein